MAPTASAEAAAMARSMVAAIAASASSLPPSSAEAGDGDIGHFDIGRAAAIDGAIGADDETVRRARQREHAGAAGRHARRRSGSCRPSARPARRSLRRTAHSHRRAWSRGSARGRHGERELEFAVDQRRQAVPRAAPPSRASSPGRRRERRWRGRARAPAPCRTLPSGSRLRPRRRQPAVGFGKRQAEPAHRGEFRPDVR